MNSWKWECFENYVKNDFFKITEHGPLHGPIITFSIRRDEELNLILETTSSGASTSNAIAVPDGTVRLATEQVKFDSQIGRQSAVAHGVIPLNVNKSFSNDESRSETRE